MPKYHRIVGFAVALGLALGLAAPARAQQPESWAWQLSPESYKKMNLHERALYDKAAELLQAGSYKAAVYWRATVGSGSWVATAKSPAFTVTSP